MCIRDRYKNNVYRQTQELADKLASHFAPKTKSYHELWLTDSATGDKQLAGGSTEEGGFDVEPIYGKFYMPRKFKMAIGYAFDNCVDLYANDLGLMALTDGDRITGYNDHMGWDEQGDGNWFYGLNVENGRIKDTESMRLKTALREICHSLNPGIRLTSHQSILFTDIRPQDKKTLETIL